jgi:hypothetical protein
MQRCSTIIAFNDITVHSITVFEVYDAGRNLAWSSAFGDDENLYFRLPYGGLPGDAVRGVRLCGDLDRGRGTFIDLWFP